jgi:hypothetical protein
MNPLKFGTKFEVVVSAGLIVEIYELLEQAMDQLAQNAERGVIDSEKAIFAIAVKIIATLANQFTAVSIEKPALNELTDAVIFSNTCCRSNSVTVGHNPRHGPVYRCGHCKSYWAINSNRLWQAVDEPFNPADPGMGLSQVFFGSGELGLGNALALGSQFGTLLLGVDLG